MTDSLAVVTGASRGIGRSCAEALGELGYRVALVGRDEAALEETAAVIANAAGAAPSIHIVDVTDDRALAAFADSLSGQPLEVLVNNAGIDIRGTLDLGIDEFDRLQQTNLRSGFVLMKQLVPLLSQARHPYVFNVASRAGKFGFANNGGYVASKFALVGLNESLYRQYADRPIRFTAICPGWVNTDMARTSGSPLPPERMIQPGDIGATLKWLLSLSPQTCVREVVIECKGSIA